MPNGNHSSIRRRIGIGPARARCFAVSALSFLVATSVAAGTASAVEPPSGLVNLRADTDLDLSSGDCEYNVASECSGGGSCYYNVALSECKDGGSCYYNVALSTCNGEDAECRYNILASTCGDGSSTTTRVLVRDSGGTQAVAVPLWDVLP